jgi:hypothetical protein
VTVVRLHIQLVTIVQGEVNVEQLLAGHGKGGGGVSGGVGGNGGDVAEWAEATDRAWEERVGEEDAMGKDEDTGDGREQEDGGDGEGGTDGRRGRKLGEAVSSSGREMRRSLPPSVPR